MSLSACLRLLTTSLTVIILMVRQPANVGSMWQYCSVWDDMIEFALTRLSELSFDGVLYRVRTIPEIHPIPDTE